MIQSMLGEHWFWGGLTLAVLVWYSTITFYVAVRGAVDIRTMLRDLAARPKADDQERVGDERSRQPPDR